MYEKCPKIACERNIASAIQTNIRNFKKQAIIISYNCDTQITIYDAEVKDCIVLHGGKAVSMTIDLLGRLVLRLE